MTKTIKNSTRRVHYGFILIYYNSYGEERSIVLECTTLREALEIATARGISFKDIIAAYNVGKLATLYKKDVKVLYSKTTSKKGKASAEETV